MTESTKTTKATESALLKGFEDVLKIIVTSKLYSKSKVQYDSELIGYALDILYNFGNVNPLKKIVLIKGMYATFKEYLESIGLYLSYKVSEDFLKVVKDSEGTFVQGTYESYATFKENQPKKEVKRDFKKSLTTLFKNKSKKEVESILQDFLKTLKN